MTTFESLYAKYYDAMYADKAYDEETAFVLEALQTNGVPKGHLLSLGAGTLNYELRLQRAGYSVHGIDIAPDMVALAKEKLQKEHIDGITVEVADMCAIPQSEKLFDGAVALFNVFAYCESLDDMRKVFNGVAKNLRAGGVFVFDCWYDAAVKHEPPQSRWKRFELPESELYRLTDASTHPDGSVELAIELIELQGEAVIGRSKEKHHVRGWDPEELKTLAKEAGLEHLHTSQFPRWNEAPDLKHWPLAMVFRRGAY